MKTIKKLIMVIVILITCLFFTDFFKFPECYLTTWKNQLHNDLLNGKAEAIEYYESNYVEKGRVLFE